MILALTPSAPLDASPGDALRPSRTPGESKSVGDSLSADARLEAVPGDAGFAAALSQFLPPPNAVRHAQPAPSAEATTASASPAEAAGVTSVTQGTRSVPDGSPQAGAETTPGRGTALDAAAGASAPTGHSAGASAQTGSSTGTATGGGVRLPHVDGDSRGTVGVYGHTTPKPPSPAGRKPERDPKGSTGHDHSADLRSLPTTGGLVGAPTPRHFNDALGELMAPRPTADVIEALKAGVENRIRGAIMEQAAHLHLQLPSGDLGVHLQFKDGLADVRLEGAVAETFRGRETELRSALAAKGIEVGEVRTTTPAEAAKAAAGLAVEAALRTQAPEPVRAPAAVAAVVESLAQARGAELRPRPAGSATDLTALQALAGRRPEAAAAFDPARAVAAAETARQAQWETEAGRQPLPIALVPDVAAPENGASDRTETGIGAAGDQGAAHRGGGDAGQPGDERTANGRDGTLSATVPAVPTVRRPGHRSAVHVEA
jgi:hypothetical protein